jgi:hypothetical protein
MDSSFSSQLFVKLRFKQDLHDQVVAVPIQKIVHNFPVQGFVFFEGDNVWSTWLIFNSDDRSCELRETVQQLIII